MPRFKIQLWGRQEVRRSRGGGGGEGGGYYRLIIMAEGWSLGTAGDAKTATLSLSIKILKFNANVH